MAGFRRKVEEWQQAGLLSPMQADAIFSYEKDRKSGKFGRGLVWLGLFAILVGILSIIASHWYSIPAGVKIGAHLILNIIVAGIAWKAARDGRDLVREGAALAFFALTLTIMALIGQVFQLDGSFTGLTTLWMVATLPFILFFGRERLTAIPWMIAFLATITVAMSENIYKLPDFWQMFFITAIGTYLPLALIGDGSLKIFRRLKPVYAEVFTRTGFVFLALNASIGSIYWIASRTTELQRAATSSELTYDKAYLLMAAIFLIAMIAIAIHAAYHKFYRDNPSQKMTALFATTSVLMIALPCLIPGEQASILAAIMFIAYWIFIGWIGQQLAWSRLISLSIVIVSLRILAIYIEVFRDMFSTGVGLIVGGCVVLGLIWMARKMNRRLTAGGAHG